MATYADTDDVTRILGLDYRLSDTTNPSVEIVESHLEEAEYEVESFTRTAWREQSASEEYYDFPNLPYNWSTGVRIQLRRNPVRQIDSGEGDKIEVWDGSSWVDYATTGSEGRDKEYWLDYEKGVLFIKKRPFFHLEKALRMTYRYGHSEVPRDITKATAMLAASMLIMNDDQSSLLVEGGEGRQVTYDSRVRMLRGQAFKILDRYASPMLLY